MCQQTNSFQHPVIKKPTFIKINIEIIKILDDEFIQFNLKRFLYDYKIFCQFYKPDSNVDITYVACMIN